ncbi:hypothetical protein D9M72_618480 [compost metagenome]
MHLPGVEGQVKAFDDVDGVGPALLAAVADGDVTQFQRGPVVRGLQDGVGTGLERAVPGVILGNPVEIQVVVHWTTFVAIGIQQSTATSPARAAQSAA